MTLEPDQFNLLFGSVTDLARRLKRPYATVAAWKHRGRIPAIEVLAVSRATGIPPHVIRPDIYPTPYREGAA